MAITMDEMNAGLRTAVRDRLDATPADDPKMAGYVAPPLAGCEPAQACAAEVLSRAWKDAFDDRQTGDGLLASSNVGSAPFLDLLEEVRQLHLSKSADYGSESDPLANIRQGAEFVGIEAWRGCMVRVADKVQRLRTFCRTGRLVHEGVRDTLLDLAAYSLLAIVLFDEGKDA